MSREGPFDEPNTYMPATSSSTNTQQAQSAVSQDGLSQAEAKRRLAQFGYKNEPTLDAAAETDLDRCREYVVYQLEERKRPPAHRPQPPGGPAITIAYQTGAGAHEVARRLAGILQAREPKGASPWTAFDRQLVEKVLEENHLPKDLAKLLTEERRSYIRDVMEELVGLRPPSWVVEPLVAESILHLAEAGHVILVGRGANFITERMPNVFHVRLIASLPKRIERVQKANGLSPAAAAKFIARTDRGRGRYAKTHFHGRVEDNLLYHLVINTDRIPPPQAADLIATGAQPFFKSPTISTRL